MNTVTTLILAGLCIFIFILKWARILLFPSPTVSRVPCISLAAVDLWGVKSAYLGMPESNCCWIPNINTWEAQSYAIWFCLFNCTTSSKRHPKWHSTYHIQPSPYTVGDWGIVKLFGMAVLVSGILSWRVRKLEKWGIMRWKRVDQEQWSRKIRSSSSFCWRLGDF